LKFHLAWIVHEKTWNLNHFTYSLTLSWTHSLTRSPSHSFYSFIQLAWRNSLTVRIREVRAVEIYLGMCSCPIRNNISCFAVMIGPRTKAHSWENFNCLWFSDSHYEYFSLSSIYIVLTNTLLFSFIPFLSISFCFSLF